LCDGGGKRARREGYEELGVVCVEMVVNRGGFYEMA
jgi:hypothetical protein